MGKIAFLLTCFNRKAKTNNCLSSLFSIVPDAHVFLVDDASTDGTSELVKSEFPSVKLIKGDGNLFWNRGMHRAWTEALKGDYDFYIWLNDDVILRPYFLDELFFSYQKAEELSIVTGVIVDAKTKQVIYGGTDANKQLHQIDGDIHDVTDMNGNVVLVPKCVVNRIGINDPVLHHAGGDTDYGYTARKNGIRVVTTTREVAEGYRNDFDRLRKWNTNIIKRFKYLYSPMGTNPNIGFYFFKKHFGIFKAIAYYIYLHLINIPPDCIMTRKQPK